MRSRERLTLAALVPAMLTAAATVFLTGAGPLYGLGGIAYLSLAALAIRTPAAIPAQVIGGQVLAGSLLLAGTSALTIAAIVAGVILTAELLAIITRETLPTTLRDDVRGAAGATLLGAFVFAIVLMPATRAAPAAMTGLTLGAAACMVLAVWLTRAARQS